MDPTVQFACVLIGATAAVVSIVANVIEICEWAKSPKIAHSKKILARHTCDLVLESEQHFWNACNNWTNNVNLELSSTRICSSIETAPLGCLL